MKSDLEASVAIVSAIPFSLQAAEVCFRVSHICDKGNAVTSCPTLLTERQLVAAQSLLPRVSTQAVSSPAVLSLAVLTLAFLMLSPSIALSQGPFGGPSSSAPPTSREAMMAEAKAVYLPDDLAAVIAVVGETKILMADVKPRVDAQLNKVLKSAKQEIPKDYIHLARVNLTRGLLKQSIQNKMMRESFLLEQVGTQAADKRKEASQTMSSRARQVFYESEVPELKKKHNVSDLAKLDAILIEEGSSLAAREREFMDAMLGHMFMRTSIDREPKITLAEVNERYQATRDQYAHKAQVKWEQLTVLFSNHESKEVAKNVIWEMGREAYFGGNVQAVARNRSEEPFASSGGLHDWTNQGSLASKQLDQQLFSLPLNKMSQVIEDDNGYHIIRILGRKPAGVKSLAEVQEDIEAAIRKKKIAASQEAMLKKMQALVPVWTIFPEDFPGSKPLQVRTAGVPDARNYR